MALCKCFACPNQGRFEVGKYYDWRYAVSQTTSKQKANPLANLFSSGSLGNSEVKSVKDEDKTNFHFSAEEYALFFKDIQCDNTSMEIYIDRKNELLFVPNFTRETVFHVTLSYFSKLPLPYTEELIGQGFLKVWEEYKDYPIVSVKEAEEAVPFYKIVMKGKGWQSFVSGHWMIYVNFISSENEMIMKYWYKRGYAFENHASDRIIERIVPMSASCEEIGHAVLAVFGEAGII